MTEVKATQLNCHFQPKAHRIPLNWTALSMVTFYRSLLYQTELDRRTTTNRMCGLFALADLQNPAGSGSEPLRTRAGGDGDCTADPTQLP
jgi:hypothetical protein